MKRDHKHKTSIDAHFRMQYDEHLIPADQFEALNDQVPEI